jgi:hypothetical protein
MLIRTSHADAELVCKLYISLGAHFSVQSRLALRRENRRGGFAAYLPFDAPVLFSSERLPGWVHGKAERAFLEKLHTRRPRPVASPKS